VRAWQWHSPQQKSNPVVAQTIRGNLADQVGPIRRSTQRAFFDLKMEALFEAHARSMRVGSSTKDRECNTRRNDGAGRSCRPVIIQFPVMATIQAERQRVQVNRGDANRV
jgi:hypothetical protein